MALRIEIPRERLTQFCRKYQIRELAFFGSVLRDDFRPDSDVDVLVSFEPGAGWSILDLVGIEEELAALLGRRVDLVERRAVEAARNPIRKRHILESAEVLYAA